MPFLYSNNFIFKNYVAANVIIATITTKKQNKFWGRFSHFRARGTENQITTGRSINLDQVEI